MKPKSATKSKPKATKSVARPSMTTQDKKWQAEDDLRTLTRAAEIQADQKRLAQAQKVTKEQVITLNKVASKAEKE